MLRLIQSNHMPILAQLFCEQSQQAADPFIPTTVVVQSFGIGQWLKLQLAERQGISANLDCILPANYIWRLYHHLLPETRLPEDSPFDRDRLAWRLMRLIPNSQHESLLRYLEAPGDPDIRQFQLSFQIAQLFDQYLVYRPDWPMSWEQGNPLLDAETLANQHWQVKLWQEVINDDPGIAALHRARLHQQLLDAISEKPKLPSGLPEKLTIFGLSSMARMQLDTFHALSEIVDIDVYFLNPCQHYWGDIVASRDVAKRSVRQLLDKEDALSDEDYLTVGNPLLGSLGKEGREFLELLLETDDVESHELFVETEGDSMLALLKNDILNLEYGGAFEEQPEQRAIFEDDKSIQVHASHSRMREIEILYDGLLSIFDSQGDIDPADVIVMAPDISEYAPFINAVFKDKIHYGIADRSLIQQSTLVASFLKIVALPTSRLTAVEVMDLLEIPAIARRFNLDEEALNKISSWIHETGIRWEYDGDEKSSRWHLPAENLNTWQFGLDRLLLGYAVEGGLYADRLPYPVDASDSELLGTLCHILRLLKQTRDRLSHSHDAAAWGELLHDVLLQFFLPEGREAIDIDQLQSLLDRLVSDVRVAAFEGSFSNELIRFWLEQQLTLAHQAPGFISGGITFATLVPMRSIPFKAVCLLGMNDADFPREQRPLSFDLMYLDGPRKGDRSRRTDDRYLFLEAILSAQKILYMSYQGKGARDNQDRPPSTVLGELLDYVTGIYPDFKATEHPLQPFSHRYYDGSLNSYQQVWYDALQHPPEEQPFIHRNLKIDEELEAESMDQLISFYRHPARYFFHNTLGVFFGDDHIELKESESFSLNPLERYQLTDLALDSLLMGDDESEWMREMIAAGRVLNNDLGKGYLDQQLSTARSIYGELRSLVTEPPVTLKENINLGSTSLSFAINTLYDQQHIDIRPGALRKRQLLEVWVKHLCLNANEHHFQTTTISRGTDKAALTVIEPIAAQDARTHLQFLVDMHDKGLSHPLCFLPECSFAYATAIASGKTRLEAIQNAQKIWATEAPGSEGQDPYWRRIAISNALFDESFEQLSIDIYSPLIANWKEL